MLKNLVIVILVKIVSKSTYAGKKFKINSERSVYAAALDVHIQYNNRPTIERLHRALTNTSLARELGMLHS